MASRGRELTLRLVSDSSQFGRGFSQAERQASTFSRRLTSVFGGTAKDIDSRAKALDSTFKGLATGIAAAFAVNAIKDFAVAAVESFRNLQESTNAVNVVFGDAAGTVLEFGEVAAESAGLAASEFNQLVVPIGSLLRNFGFDADEAANAAIELTQRAADMASVFNTDVSEALGAIQAALRGESDPIERFGASISAARVEAFLLGEGLVESKNAITDQDKVMGRYRLILQDTARVAGDFANTSEDNANATRIFQARLEDLRAKAGEAIIPLFSDMVDAGTDLLPVFEDLATDVLPQVVDAIGNFIAGVQAIAQFVSDLPGPVQAVGAAIGGLSVALYALYAHPVIAGLAVVAGAIALIGDQAREEKQAVDDMREAIEGLTSEDGGGESELLSTVREQISGTVEDSADLVEVLDTLGINLRQATGFVLGDPEDIEAVTSAFERFNDARAESVRAGTATADDTSFALGPITDFEAGLNAVAERYREVQAEAEEAARIEAALADVSPFDIAEANRFGALQDLAAAAQEGAAEVGEAIDEEFDKAQKIAQKSADDLNKSIEGAAADFGSAISLFAEAPEDLEKIDLDAALGNIEVQIGRIERFNEALSTLSGAGLDQLVADLAAQGPEAVLTAEALASDIGTAFDLESALEEGNATALDAAVTAVVGQRSEFQDDLEQLGEFLALDIENGFANLDLTVAVTRAINEARSVAGIGSGSSGGSAAVSFGARANGGRVDRGHPYIVGERQAEMFVPDTAGRILPSVMSGGGGGSFNFSPTVVNPSTEDLGKTLDTQRILLQASVGRMVEAL